MKNNKIWKMQRSLWCLVSVLITLALIKGYAANPPSDRLDYKEAVMLDDKWEIHGNGEVREYEFTIPENMTGSLSLIMKTYLRDIHLLLDGEEFYSFYDRYGMDGGSRFIIRLPGQSEGKRLVLRTFRVDGFSVTNAPVNAYLGERDSSAAWLFRSNLYALIFGLGSLIQGTGILSITLYMRKRGLGEINRGMAFLGGFILVTGVWVVTDSGLLLLFTNQVALVSMISFVSFWIMPIFLLQFVNFLLGRKPVLDILSCLFLAISVAYLLNYLIRVVPGYCFVYLDHLLCLYSIWTVLRLGHRSMQERENEEMKDILMGFAVLSIFVLGALVVFYINPTYNYPFLYCIGIYLFYIFLTHAAFSCLYQEIRKNIDLAAYERLAYMDTMTGMANRTAFTEAQERECPYEGRTYILMDINNLKSINDRYGHHEGDALIIEAARCIQEAFGDLGICYRIGGDEFVVILERSTEKETKERLAGFKKMLEKINETRAVPLEIAAGCAIGQDAADTPGKLFQRADADMYAEKQKMKNAAANLHEERR